MKKSFSLIILLLSAIYIIAQPSQMLEKGRSGVSCAYTLAREEGIKASGFELGYSYKGIADLSGVYLMSFMDASRIGVLRNSAIGNYKGLEVAYWPVRTNFSSRMYFKTGVIAGAGESKYDKVIFWDHGSHSYYNITRNRLYYGGIESLLNVSLTEHWIIQPMVAITYNYGREYYSKSGYLGSSQNYDDYFINGSLNVGYKTKAGAIIGVGFAFNLIALDETNPVSGGLEIVLPL